MPQKISKPVTAKVPKLRFPGFSGGWEEKELRDVAYTTTGSSNREDSTEEGAFTFFDRSEDIRASSRYLFDAEAIIIAGEGQEFYPKYFVGKFDLHQRTYAIMDFKNAVGKFIFYSIIKNRKYFNKVAVGSTVPSLRLPMFDLMPVMLPIKEEQQEIAEFLCAVGEWVQNLRAQKESLDTYKKGMMQKIFAQEIRFKDENGKDFPVWKEQRLKNVVAFVRGGVLSKSDLDPRGKYLCIHYGELFTQYKEVITDVISRTNVDTGTDSEAGDILMPTSDVTPEGLAKASSLQERGVKIGGDVNILRPNEGINSVMLSYMLNFYQKRIIKIVSGSTVRHVYSSDLGKLKYFIPSNVKEQQKIADFFTSLDNLIESKQQQIIEAETWKKGLMQCLFV